MNLKRRSKNIATQTRLLQFVQEVAGAVSGHRSVRTANFCNMSFRATGPGAQSPERAHTFRKTPGHTTCAWQTWAEPGRPVRHLGDLQGGGRLLAAHSTEGSGPSQRRSGRFSGPKATHGAQCAKSSGGRVPLFDYEGGTSTTPEFKSRNGALSGDAFL